MILLVLNTGRHKSVEAGLVGEECRCHRTGSRWPCCSEGPEERYQHCILR